MHRRLRRTAQHGAATATYTQSPISAAPTAWRGVGETKTPDALRNASDQFFEWVKPEPQAELVAETQEKGSPKAAARFEAPKAEQPKPLPKRRPRSVVEAVTLLAADTPEGKVNLGPLGQYLKRTDPSFSPQIYGHSGLLDMLRTYDLLAVQQELGNHWSVRLAPQAGEGDTASHTIDS